MRYLLKRGSSDIIHGTKSKAGALAMCYKVKTPLRLSAHDPPGILRGKGYHGSREKPLQSPNITFVIPPIPFPLGQFRLLRVCPP